MIKIGKVHHLYSDFKPLEVKYLVWLLSHIGIC